MAMSQEETSRGKARGEVSLKQSMTLVMGGRGLGFEGAVRLARVMGVGGGRWRWRAEMRGGRRRKERWEYRIVARVWEMWCEGEGGIVGFDHT